VRTHRILGSALLLGLAGLLIWGVQTVPTSSGSGTQQNYRSKDLGVSVAVPSGWHVWPLSGCQTNVGFFVSNVDRVSSSCAMWPPVVTGLSKTSAVLFVGAQLPSANSRYYFPRPIRETPIPINLGDLQGGDGQWAANPTFHGVGYYQLGVWLGGGERSPSGILAQRVLGSLRPWTPPPPGSPPNRCGDGWEWTPVTTVLPYGASILAMDAVSSNDVWAVGSYMHPYGGGTRPYLVSSALAMHWDGAQGSVLPVPDPGLPPGAHGPEGGSIFDDVAAISSTDVWAVGGRNANTPFGLIEHWDGTRWSVVPGAKLSLLEGELYSVAAAGPNEVWAVGTSPRLHDPTPLSLEHWNGTTWRASRTPPGGKFVDTAAVAALSPADAWAVGGGSDLPVPLQWDGTAWAGKPAIPVEHLLVSGALDLGPKDAWVAGTSYRRGPGHPVLGTVER
jgi:hypothetical protein